MQGCKHDRGSDNACSNTNYNYGFRDPQGAFRSILAYNCAAGKCDGYIGGGCPRVQRFSNNYAKYKLYNGKPIGNELNDNARKINNVASVVSNYYPLPTPVSTLETPPPS